MQVPTNVDQVRQPVAPTRYDEDLDSETEDPIHTEDYQNILNHEEAEPPLPAPPIEIEPQVYPPDPPHPPQIIEPLLPALAPIPAQTEIPNTQILPPVLPNEPEVTPMGDQPA